MHAAIALQVQLRTRQQGVFAMLDNLCAVQIISFATAWTPGVTIQELPNGEDAGAEHLPYFLKDDTSEMEDDFQTKTASAHLQSWALSVFLKIFQ